jgi:hypothetical protein
MSHGMTSPITPQTSQRFSAREQSVVWYILTYDSEELTASIFRVMMETVNSSETFVNV